MISDKVRISMNFIYSEDIGRSNFSSNDVHLENWKSRMLQEISVFSCTLLPGKRKANLLDQLCENGLRFLAEPSFSANSPFVSPLRGNGGRPIGSWRLMISRQESPVTTDREVFNTDVGRKKTCLCGSGTMEAFVCRR